MSKGTVAKKNANMAQYMKSKGIVRARMACPMCHSIIQRNGLDEHLLRCGK